MSVTDGEYLPNGLGKERRRSSRAVILAVIIVAILIVGAVAWLAVTVVNNRSEYTKHSPISIVGNGGFTHANGVVGGTGTASDPYIIANWDVDASTANGNLPSGILVQDTDAHFTVRNCRVHGGSGSHYGITLSNCRNGTLKTNNCSENGQGIYLRSSSGNALIGNGCSSNTGAGIWLDSSSTNNTLSNNNCSNVYDGIYLIYSSDNTLSNNNCSNDYDGIYLRYSSNNTLSANNCTSNNDAGIVLQLSSHNNTLVNNNCSSNKGDGIWLGYSSNNNQISWNLVSNNDGCGVNISWGADNRIWYNIIIGDNGATDAYHPSNAQAFDDGTENSWNITDAYGNHGNYWSDWTTPDAVPPQGIVDHPYILLGSAGAKDYYPLSYDPRYIGISFILSCLS